VGGQAAGVQIEFIASFAVITTEPAPRRGLFLDVLGLPLAPDDTGDYFFTEQLGGAKHFGVWPLSQAAQACFGTPAWPSDRQVPQACVEFEVADEAAVRAAEQELVAAGYVLLHTTKTEPWGQTVVRLQERDGTIIGISFAPWMHAGEQGAG
jgi:hypothetical protein